MSARSDLAAGLSPMQLVPGDVGALFATAEVLDTWGAACRVVDTGLLKVEALWTGAAYEAWREARLEQSAKWRAADTAFSDAAAAVDTYRRALVGGRASAEYARTLYDTGLEKQAAAQENARRQRAEMRAQGIRVYVEPNTTAGTSEMERAVTILEVARAEVRAAGETAARALEAAEPPKDSVWQQALRGARWVSPMAWFVESNWDSLSDPETWYTLSMWNRDPQVSREAGAGILVGAGEVLLMASGPNSPALTKAWKSATNTWSWQLGLDPSSAAAAMGVLLGREVLSNIRVPGGSQGLAMREAAEEGLVRAEQLIQKHSANSIEEMWGISPFARGYIAEAMQGGNLPYGFRVFDRLDDGNAISIKSIDLNAPSYADSPTAVERRLNRYLDAVMDVPSRTRQGVIIGPGTVSARVLEIVIPEGSATPDHQAVVDSIVRRADEYTRLNPGTSPVRVRVVEL